MKVTATHLESIRTAIAPLDTNDNRTMYRNGQFPRAELVKDLDKRYRWDLFYASGALREVQDAGYAMTHLDTALRSIVETL